MITKPLTCLILAIGITAGHAEDEAPEAFSGLLMKGKPVKAQIGKVIPPADIDKYVAKVAATSRKNPEWFESYLEKHDPATPLPYHEKLGLTKEEYDNYIKLWSQREFKALEEVTLLLRQSSDGYWIITATGSASTLSTLRYNPKTDTFRSPNGKMARIDDIDAPAESIFGAWKGQEWRYAEENSLGTTKENIAMGQMANGKHAIILYRVQELTAAGTRLLDKSLMIRLLSIPKK